MSRRSRAAKQTRRLRLPGEKHRAHLEKLEERWTIGSMLLYMPGGVVASLLAERMLLGESAAESAVPRTARTRSRLADQDRWICSSPSTSATHRRIEIPHLYDLGGGGGASRRAADLPTPKSQVGSGALAAESVSSTDGTQPDNLWIGSGGSTLGSTNYAMPSIAGAGGDGAMSGTGGVSLGTTADVLQSSPESGESGILDPTVADSPLSTAVPEQSVVATPIDPVQPSGLASSPTTAVVDTETQATPASDPGMRGEPLSDAGGPMPAPFPTPLVGWTIDEYGGSESGHGSVTVDYGAAVLREGDSFLVTLSHTFEVPPESSALSFSFEGPTFDLSDPDFINDAFEVALVDSAGGPLVHTAATGYDAFFNISEDQSPALGAETSLDGQTVSVDLSAVLPGTEATLVFRLVNNDDDTATSVRITGISIPGSDEPPEVVCFLVNDTAPVGPGAEPYLADGLTNDATIVGAAVDDKGIARIEARVDDGPAVDITPSLVAGEFRFTPGELLPGSHSIIVRATDTSGQSAEDAVQFVMNSPPIADGGGNRTIGEGSTVLLDGSASTDSEAPIFAYQWALDDGTQVDEISATRHFIQDGLFLETLTVTDTAGSTDTDAVQVTVVNLPASMTTLADQAASEGDELAFTGQFADPGVLDTHTAVVDWGDTRIEPAVVTETQGAGTVSGRHVYVNDGRYLVTVTVTDDGGAEASTQFTVLVHNLAPTVLTATDLTGYEGQRLDLVGTFSDPGTQDTHTALVHWSDGTTSAGEVTESNGQGVVSASHTYADNGVWPISLVVTDNAGDSGSLEASAAIANVAPALTAGLSYRSVAGPEGEALAIVIAGSFTDPGFSFPQANTVETFTVSVDWGDGQVQPVIPSVTQGSEGVLTVGSFSAAHGYVRGGVYTAKVTVRDDDGGEDSASFVYGVARIDVKPSVNTGAKGVIPVEIFSDPTFDATQINPLSLDFGPGGAAETHGQIHGSNKPFSDVMTHFDSQTSAILPSDTVAFLTGQLNDGTLFVGMDTIRTVPPHTTKFFVVDSCADATFGYAPDGLKTANIALDPQTFEPRGIASNAAGDTLWVIDALDHRVTVQGADGRWLGSWLAQGLQNPQGIATNGSDIWIVDRGLGRVLRFAGGASLRTGAAVAAAAFPLHAGSPSDLATDGSLLWVTDDAADAVFVYDTAGMLLGQWQLDPANSDPSGVTNNPSGGSDLWVVDRVDRLVYHYAAGTSLRNGSVVAAGTFALVGANVQPEGIADPPVLSILSPSDGDHVQAGNAILVTGQALPGDPSAPVARVAINGTTVEVVDAAGNFFSRATPSQGRNLLEVVATDMLNETATASLTLDAIQSPADAPNFDLLTDITGLLDPEYGRTSFNEGTDLLHAALSLRNAANFDLHSPLLVGITQLSDPTVRVRGADGFTPEGMPYFDFTELMAADVFVPDDVTAARDIVFYNPERVQFTYDLVILGKLNAAPTITTVPVVAAYLGRPYQYDADATDPDGDQVAFSLKAGPAGLAADSTTGQLAWNPADSDKGSHGIILRVEDGRGGYAEQHYVLSAIDAPPNRPPVITSVPVVDAIVNQSYSYDVDAVDSDGDFLTYSLSSVREDYRYVISNDAPVSYWRLGEASGSIALDTSEAVNHGAYLNGVTLGAAGALAGDGDTSARFDGQNDLISVPDTSSLRPSRISVEAWVNPASLANWATILTKTSSGSWNDGYGLAHYTGSNDINFFINYYSNYKATGTLVTGRWSHVVGTYDGSAISLYIDGSLANSVPYSSPITHSVAPLRIGSGTGEYPWNGFVDEIAVYDRALSPDEVRQHYQTSVAGPHVISTFPDGMNIGPAHGLIEWTPDQSQLGQHVVSVEASDGRGGIARQEFVLSVQPEAGNHRPIIISDPVTGHVFGQAQPITVSPGFASSLLYELPDGQYVRGMAISTDGKLYFGTLTTIYQYDLNNSNASVFKNTGLSYSDRMVVADGKGGFGDDLLHTDHNVTGNNQGTVFRTNRTTRASQVLLVGAVNRYVGDPFGAAVGMGGGFGHDLYVMDFQGASTQPPLLERIRSTGECTIFAEGPLWGNDSVPADIAFSHPEGPFGNYLYVTDHYTYGTGAGYRKIWRVGESGEMSEFLASQRIWPAAFRFGAGGPFGSDMYIANWDRRILRVSPEGEINEFARDIGAPSTPSIFSGIPDMAFSPDGTKLYIGADERVYVIEADPTNVGYSYDVDAVDYDGDTLQYSLLVAPDGMTINAPTGEIAWTAPTGKALSFDGVNDFVRIPHDTALDIQSAFTVELWFKASPQQFSGDTHYDLIDKSHRSYERGPAYFSGWALQGRTDLPNFENDLTFVVGNGSYFAAAQTDTFVLDDRWHHAAGVFDGSHVQLYVDGALQRSVPFVGTAVNNTDPLEIGRWAIGQTRQFHGLVDEVRFWNVVRNPEQIQAAMHTDLVGTEPGLVAYLRLNEGQGTSAVDATGHGHNGLLGNGSSVAYPAWVSANRDLLEVPVAVRVDDGNGGADEQSFIIRVTDEGCEIRGTKFLDLNSDGIRYRGTNLILNGSFEKYAVDPSVWTIPHVADFGLNGGNTNIDHWTVINDTADYINGPPVIIPGNLLAGWTAADGSRSLDLGGNPGAGGVSQTFATMAGETYEVRFFLSGNSDDNNLYPEIPRKSVRVRAAGQWTDFSFDVDVEQNTYRDMKWKECWFEFVAVSDQTTLEIFSTTGRMYGGPALDGVSVVQIEPPAAGWVMYLDEKRNNRRDPGERCTTTDENGNYVFTGLAPGTYVVAEEPRPGWTQTAPRESDGDNLISNGSFEIYGIPPEQWSNPFHWDHGVPAESTAIANWTVVKENIDYIRDDGATGWQASEGERSLDLSNWAGRGGVSQSFATLPGQWYEVSFDLSGNPDPYVHGPYADAEVKTIRVQAAGQSADFSYSVAEERNTFREMKWQSRKWRFLANSALTTLELLNTMSDAPEVAFRGPAIDNVSVRQVGYPRPHVVTVAAGQTVAGVDFGNVENSESFGNLPPICTSQPITTAEVQNVYRYNATAFDANNDLLAFDLPVRPRGLAVDPTTGAVVWRPTTEQVGIHDVILRVSDGAGGVDLQSFQIEVRSAQDSHPPIIVSQPVTRVNPGQTYRYDVEALDPDNDPLKYSLAVSPADMAIDPVSGLISWQVSDQNKALSFEGLQQNLWVKNGFPGAPPQTPAFWRHNRTNE